MNRRDFFKTTAAAGAVLMLPRLVIRPAEPRHAILQSFCDPHAWSRFDLSEPIVQQGMAYGTDARAIVRAATAADDTLAEARKVPRCWEPFDQLWREWGPWQPLPPLNYGGSIEYCVLCDRFGDECLDCHGEGDRFIDNDHWAVWCESCQGTGYAIRPECPLCHGAKRELPSGAVFGDKLIRLDFRELLERIPGVEWNLGVRAAMDPILFRAQHLGIEGMVMPMKN